ncbi:MAG: cysteine desulfurase [Planctomycetes bacterium]|nr:cysteine desulfurase [Planctomycetota bacterium]
MNPKTSPIYLDNGTTTRIDPLVSGEMSAFEREGLTLGVPAQAHSCGRAARKALNASRDRIARCLGFGGRGDTDAGVDVDVDEKEIVFTSGATEANNLALIGAAQALRRRGNHIITSSIEHPSVLLTCRALERQGFAVTYVPVNNAGMVDPADVAEAIRDNTILISIILADSEVGAIQPIRDIADVARSREIPFHTDAAQAAGKIPVHPADLGVDMLSLSAHKFHGPKGIGVLYVRSGTRITPSMHGGPDETALRPGTLNIANCVGMAKALELATDNLKEDTCRMASLRDRLRDGLTSEPCCATPNGPADDRDRLPGTLNLRFEGKEGGEAGVGIEAESLILNLDMVGVCVGAGNPCASGSLEPSYVLRAMGLSPAEASSSIRFCVARDTTPAEIDTAIERLGTVTLQLRSVPV